MGTCATITKSRDESGATTVEHTIVLPLFLLILIGIIDACYASYSALSLQFAASRVLREIVIDPGSFAARASIVDELKSYGINISQIDAVTLCPVDLLGSTCPENTINAGAERELVSLRIRKRVKSFIIGGLFPLSLDLRAEAVGRNETS